MQVTKKLEYAILSVLYLAERDGLCEISEVAATNKIPASFVAKIVQDLVKAGVLASRRGTGGGYRLARPASEISLHDISEAVDGPLAISDCLQDGASCDARDCRLQAVWGSVQEALQEKLKSITLADILRHGSGDAAGLSGSGGASAGRPVILCDFDGTISRQDVADTIFTKWLGETWAAIDREYHEGAISMVELYERCWPLVGLSEGELIEFLATIEIDGHFEAFIERVRGEGIPIYLVSDGFDYYIERIMQRHGLGDLGAYSNHLSFSDGEMVLGFDNQREDCALCANCKKTVMDAKRADADFVIYVGNGYSDRCAAEHADLVFAKDALRAHCDEKGIPYVPYQSFDEVLQYLTEHNILR